MKYFFECKYYVRKNLVLDHAEKPFFSAYIALF